ncbi:dimethylsulfonioproprionate lyase family protein [Pseudodonghicola flavimaris]|uniref:Dimethylsulfonioproprionate lyase family protein n=1 Tax=Pseudodonghicola flavimaris TaxID=3050036 RepID=A0ABT7EZB0_9RHOB|nr:dimethylsulfonioproprionate lyase family protein [Pseudodonghicola flavimaris]MDK3017691.1 dimethylsulfonioproprionate lyase family protein [Pseudodonghicola flavimaris]
MQQTTVLDFFAAMAAIFEAEGRPEAVETAAALCALANPELTPLTGMVDTDPIRDLLQTSPLPVAAAMLAVLDQIPWGINPVSGQASAEALSSYVSSDLMGPDSPIFSNTLRVGLFYQRPDTRYGLHSHAAAETYAIIAGRALWTAGDTQKQMGPGDYVHHSTYLPHACETGPEGVLAIWRWSGDIGVDSYRIHDGLGAFGL